MAPDFRDRRRGCWIHDADDHSRTRPESIPDQRGSKSQVAAIEATLSKEEQATSALDNHYDTAVQNLSNAQSALQTINAKISQTQGSKW